MGEIPTINVISYHVLPSQACAEVLASIGLGGIQNLMLERDSTAMKVVGCCRPDRYFNAEEDFIAFWKEIKQTVGSSAVTNPPSRLLLN